MAVMVLERRRVTMRGGANRSRIAAGPIEKMVCSKVSVKSKSERQPWAIGPKALSFDGWHRDVSKSLWFITPNAPDEESSADFTLYLFARCDGLSILYVIF